MNTLLLPPRAAPFGEKRFQSVAAFGAATWRIGWIHAMYALKIAFDLGIITDQDVSCSRRPPKQQENLRQPQHDSVESMA